MKKLAPLVACLIGIVSNLFSVEPKDGVVGVARLENLTKSRTFMLSKIYSGMLTLKLGESDINHRKEFRRTFNCFTYAVKGLFSEPDAPTPTLDAISHQIGNSILGWAFFDREIESVAHKLKDVKTMADFRLLVPRAIRMTSEDPNYNNEAYDYSWAVFDDEGRLTVKVLEVEQDQNNFHLWLWEGECSPIDKKAEQE